MPRTVSPLSGRAKWCSSPRKEPDTKACIDRTEDRPTLSDTLKEVLHDMIRHVFIALMLATPAVAQDIEFSTDATENCLENDGADCIGRSADACMEATDGGTSTAGMGACLEKELEWWDGRLNAAYGKAMEVARSADEAEGERSLTQADALRDMQRAWITFRDAKCDWETVQWGGGTGAGPARLSCLMHTTGEQSLVLERHLEQR